MINNFLFKYKILAIRLLVILSSSFCSVVSAEPYEVTSSKGDLTFTLDEDWEHNRIQINGKWWYTHYEDGCTYIWPEDKCREKAYKIEQISKCPNIEFGMEFQYSGWSYSVNDVPDYFTCGEHTLCYDNGAPSSTRTSLSVRDISFSWNYEHPDPFLDDYCLDERYKEEVELKRKSENEKNSRTLWNSHFGDIVFKNAHSITLLQILFLSGIFGDYSHGLLAAEHRADINTETDGSQSELMSVTESKERSCIFL